MIEELRATFDYHPDGYLIRKKNGKPCGQHVNCHNGYIKVFVNEKTLQAHRVIYAIVHGEMPGEIDHINKDRADNRIENLRNVSHSVNIHNSRVPKTNTSGFPGVDWDARNRKWHARIMLNNQRVSLGRFEDFDEAVYARKMAKIRYHPSSPEAFKFALELFPCGAV